MKVLLLLIPLLCALGGCADLMKTVNQYNKDMMHQSIEDASKPVFRITPPDLVRPVETPQLVELTI